MVLPNGSFDLRESLEFMHDSRRCLLTPVEFEEAGSGFEIGRYRESVID